MLAMGYCYRESHIESEHGDIDTKVSNNLCYDRMTL